jgi:hypothetical protein
MRQCPWSWQFLSYSRNCLHFMQPECSLPFSQQLTTCPCPEPNKSGPCLPIYLFAIRFNITLPSTTISSKCTSVFRFPRQNPAYISLRTHTCHMPYLLTFLDCIARILFSKEVTSWSSSLCSVLQSPITSSLLPPSTSLSTLFSNTLSLPSSLSVWEYVQSV